MHHVRSLTPTYSHLLADDPRRSVKSENEAYWRHTSGHDADILRRKVQSPHRRFQGRPNRSDFIRSHQRIRKKAVEIWLRIDDGRSMRAPRKKCWVAYTEHGATAATIFK